MPDIRSLGQVSNGKLIYQLVSASVLKDTDLFAISTTDNLTRKVSLSQIKSSFNANYYNKEDTDVILDNIRQQIKNVSNELFQINNDITEFRNEFNNKLSVLSLNLRQDINNIDIKFTDITNEIIKSINNVDNKLNDLSSSLSNTITDLDVKLTSMITNMFQYGTDVPITLETGRAYLQYF